MMDDQKYPFSQLEGAVAFRHPNLIGDDLAVALDFGKVTSSIIEGDAVWPVLSMLDAHSGCHLSSGFSLAELADLGVRRVSVGASSGIASAPRARARRAACGQITRPLRSMRRRNVRGRQR